MFKKLFLAVCLVLLSVSVALSCTVPAGTHVWVIMQQGVAPGVAPEDRDVEMVDIQPSVEALKEFSKEVEEDYTDGVVMLDARENVYILVHKGLLKDCE